MNMLRLVLTIAMLASTASMMNIAPAAAGSCDHSYQTDKNGNSCGGRAADQRKGGKY